MTATQTARTSSGTARPQPPERRFRTDIQALRALAVGLVVLNHLWPLRLPGGYVGVDVFFVISGYLISSHLLRELETTGRLRFGSFYSRRARRLFPAAFLVLSASILLAVLFLPFPRWIDTAQEVAASIFYAENWFLVVKSVDYSAANASASAVQHYWSLSVEEQFYLFWPLALVLFAGIARWLNRPVRHAITAGVVAVAVLSLGCSVLVTGTLPQQAYFATPVRVWEFAVGALIGLAGGRALTPLLRNVLPVAGGALILASALNFDAQTPFPGAAALVPVLGTGLVILAGSGKGGPAHDRVAGLCPVQFIGKISYSLYLWHWPLIVAAPFVFGRVPTAPYKVLLLFASILLAWLTKAFVEDVWVRRRGRHTRRVWNGFLAPVAGMAAVTVAAVLLGAAGSYREEQTAELTAAGASGPCYGAAAIGNRLCGEDPFAAPVAAPHMGAANEYWVVPDECLAAEAKTRVPGAPAVCDFSEGKTDPEVVWLIGDSHAQQWQKAIMALGHEHGWMVKWTYAGACPHVDARLSAFNGAPVSAEAADKCSAWGQTVTRTIESERPDRVFVSMFAAREVIDDGTGRLQADQYADGLTRIWQRWTAQGTTVMPIYDPPLNAGSGRPVECLGLNAATPLSCAMPREKALEYNPFETAVEQANSENVVPVDLLDYFCDDVHCFSAVGGVSVYYDADHLNAQFVTTLIPQIEDLLD